VRLRRGQSAGLPVSRRPDHEKHHPLAVRRTPDRDHRPEDLRDSL